MSSRRRTVVSGDRPRPRPRTAARRRPCGRRQPKRHPRTQHHRRTGRHERAPSSYVVHLVQAYEQNPSVRGRVVAVALLEALRVAPPGPGGDVPAAAKRASARFCPGRNRCRPARSSRPRGRTGSGRGRGPRGAPPRPPPTSSAGSQRARGGGRGTGSLRRSRAARAAWSSRGRGRTGPSPTPRASRRGPRPGSAPGTTCPRVEDDVHGVGPRRGDRGAARWVYRPVLSKWAGAPTTHDSAPVSVTTATRRKRPMPRA